MPKKLYLVTADTYCGRWGAEIYAFAICDTLEKAKEEQLKTKHEDVVITEMEMNTFEPKYLGGYIE